MRLPRFLVQQLGHPSGAAGNIVGRLLNRGNAGINAAAIAALDLRQGERVLDVGFGGGASLPGLLAAVGRHGRVTAVELAPDMVRAARRRFAPAVVDARLDVQEASAMALPFPAGGFDAALTVNSIYFWPDPAKGVAELRRVLAPHGRLVVAVRPAGFLRAVGFPDHGLLAPEERDLKALLLDAGFATAHVVSRQRFTLAIGRVGGKD